MAKNKKKAVNVSMFVKWLIIAGALFLGEALTPGFILMWFGIGALVGALLSLTGLHLYVQIAAFIITSTVLLIFTRPIVKKLIKQKDMPSNVFAMIGKRGVVIQEIDNILGQGQVKIGGEVWRSESENGEGIEVETEVEVIRVDGVKVIVSQAVKSKLKEEVSK